MDWDLQIAPWPAGRRFAYSITYDEGLVEVLGFAWRLHRDFDISGHINVYFDRIGRLEGDSSAGFLQSLWRLRKYADSEHLRWLAEQGWTIGCQFSEPTGSVSAADVLTSTRHALQTSLGIRVESLAFADGVTWSANAAAARSAGFRWLLPYFDALNPADGRADVIRRSPLYHRGPAPNRMAYDPYRLLAAAAETNGWVVDVVRLVDRYPVDPARDCMPGELESRFRAVYEIGGRAVWCANVEDAARYRACRAATRLEMMAQDGLRSDYVVRQVLESDGDATALTFLMSADPAHGTPEVYIDDLPVTIHSTDRLGQWQFSCVVADGARIRFAGGV